MFKYMNKISSITLTFVFIFSFVGVSLISPQKASAASISSAQLQSKATKLQKLELLRKCVDSSYFLDGFQSGTSPFSLGSVDKQDGNINRVGHLVDSKNGRWACRTGEDKVRENQLFKLLLVNGSEKNYYEGFLGGGDKAYTADKNKNVNDVEGDDNPIYRYINQDNKTDYNMNLKNDGLSRDEARNKITKQIDRSRNLLYKDLSGKEKNALRYENLAAAFYSAEYGCKAKEIDVSNRANIPEGKDIVKVGDISYTVGDAKGKVSVGFGELGTNDGDLNCENIAASLTANKADWQSVTKSSGQVPPGAVDGGSGTATAGEDNTCEAKSGVTAWFACPFVAAAGEALNWIDEQINTYMVISPDLYKDSDSLYQAWTAFRNIALSLLIAAMMVIVISTALGLSFLDAYTVKKAFPRLVVSIIFILLSWWVCVFLIDLVNVIGQGILGLMTAPFPDTGSLGQMFTTDNAAANVAGAAGSWAILGIGIFFIANVPGTLGILGSWIGAGILVLLAAYVTLIARQMFIIVLIIFSPLAILAWIFPASSKAWRFWWEGFIKALLMYPMVMALIGAGRIFSSVSGNAKEGLLGAILKLTAYIIPYAFIPFTFKAAGGLFGNFAGMVNNRSKGGFDRLRKVRQKNTAEMGQRAKAGQLTKGSSRFNNRVNRAVRGAAAGPSNGFGLASTARGRIFDDEQAAVDAVEMKKTAAWQGAQFKDNTMRALTHTNESDARAELVSRGVTGAALDEALIGAKKIGYGRTSQIAAAQQLAVNKTGLDNAADAASLVDRVAGSNGTLRSSLRENVKYTSKQVGRNDLGALSDRQAGETEQQWNDRMTNAGFENIDPYSLGREHSKSYENLAASNANEFEDAVRSYSSPGGRTTMNKDRVIAARTRIEETMKNAPSATGTNAREAVRLSDRIAGADERIRQIDETQVQTGTDSAGAPIYRGYSEILGWRADLPVQGAVQGQVGTGGLARTTNPRDEERMRNQGP